MAKRFTSTEIWVEDWFLDMPNEYKLFWYYMLSNCDHAGIFRVNTKTFSNLLEVNVSASKFLELVNKNKMRVRPVSTSSWFIEDFFFYQYGTTFNINNKLHNSILKIYNKFNINILDVRGLKEVKLSSSSPLKEDKVGVKDKDKDISISSKKPLEEINTEQNQKFKEDMIVLEMMKIWKKYNPKYFEEKENDYVACLQMAYKIARAKGWQEKEVLEEREADTIKSWEKIVSFVVTDNFFKNLALKNLANQFQMIFQKMANVNSDTTTSANLPKKEKSRADIEKEMEEWMNS